MIWFNILFIGIYTIIKINAIPEYVQNLPQEHLVPPPPPPPPASPLQPQPQNPAYLQSTILSKYSQQSVPTINEPTYMQRIARWFGFGQNNANTITDNKDQQIQPSINVNIQERHIESSADNSNGKLIGCFPCNKIPWMPMFTHTQQYSDHQIKNVQFKHENKQYYQPNSNLNLPIHYNNIHQNNHHHSIASLKPPPPKRYISTYKHSSHNHLPQYNIKYFNNILHQQNQHPQRQQYSTYKVQNDYQLQQHRKYPNQQQLLPIYSPNQYNQYNTYKNPISSPSLHLYPIDQINSNIAPIPVPNLSVTPIPPIYDSKPFLISTFENLEINKNNNNGPHFEPTLNIHSETIPNKNSQGLLSFNNEYGLTGIIDDSNSDIEIVKSVPVAEFTSSVEYPINVVPQTSGVDGTNNNGNGVINNVPYNENNQPSGHYITTSIDQQQTTSPNDFISEPIVVHGTEENFTDSYSSASVHNLTVQHEDNKIIGNYVTIEKELSPIDSTESNPEIHSLSPSSLSHSTGTYKSSETYAKQFNNNNNNNNSNKIEFLPSIQTNLDKIPNYTTQTKDTAKDLLDSTIVYMKTTSTRNPSDLRVTKYPDIKYNSNQYKTTSYPSSTLYSTTSSSATSYTTISANGKYSKMPPPLPPSPQQQQQQKPKQRQIIIPYTTNNRPSPFKLNKYQNFEKNNSNWFTQLNKHDFHDSQESKIVTATVTKSPTILSIATKTTTTLVPPLLLRQPTKYLTKIVASNLRELLKQEKNMEKLSLSTFDIKRLQKNIDDWTEQEFSVQPFNNNNSNNNKATTSSFIQSKNIPSDYLTTTAMPSEEFSTIADTTTTTTITTPTTTTRTTIDPYEKLLSDEEFKKFEFLGKFIDNNQLNPESFTIAPKYKFIGTTTDKTPLTTTTQSPPSSSSIDYWNHVKISISPLTNEKVYVVTPQPQINYNKYKNNNNNNNNNDIDTIGQFKSPRFIIRPTPGSSTDINISTNSDKRLTLSEKINRLQTTTDTLFSKHKPELFGLMDVSTFRPHLPVETIYANSKVSTTPHQKQINR